MYRHVARLVGAYSIVNDMVVSVGFGGEPPTLKAFYLSCFSLQKREVGTGQLKITVTIVAQIRTAQ
jgi:hypothetical protein